MGKCECDRDGARIVERRAEPAVVVAADDRRRAVLRAGKDPDDVRGLRRAARRIEHQADARSRCSRQSRGILASDRHARHASLVPDPVERPERSVGLVVGASAGRRGDHRRGTAEAELEPDVVWPQALDEPVDEDDLAAHVHAVELLAAAAPDVDELPRDTRSARFRHAAEGSGFESLPVLQLDECVLEAPRVDRNRLLDDVRQPGGAKLGRDERRGCTLLRRPGDAEPERV